MFLGANDTQSDSLKYLLSIGSQTNFFDEVMDIRKISSLISLYSDCPRRQICHNKTTFQSKTVTTNNFGGILLPLTLVIEEDYLDTSVQLY